MGKFNSSSTRVAPVFDQLFAADRSGASWLPGLLDAVWPEPKSALLGPSPTLIPAHRRTWGDNERSLSAPLRLLEHLVESITLEQVNANGDVGPVLEHRRKLAERDPATIAAALAALRAGGRGRKWFVLEGASRPDATLETADHVLVIEGKRTERTCTSKTKWMGKRSQLVRHMDAAMDCFPNKRILGLLIVEGDGGADAIHPSAHWCRETVAQASKGMLRASLPHRKKKEQDAVAAGILGVVTWQRVCLDCRIGWPPTS